MAEYIEREALQKAMQRKKAGVADKRYTEGWNDCLLRMKSMVHGAKAADVAPVVHGEWETEICSNGWNEWDNLICKNCGKKFERVAWPSEWHFCPNCGADMRERKGDDGT